MAAATTRSSTGPLLETERLRLRRFRRGDLDAVARWQSDPRFMLHMGRGPFSREESERSLRRYDEHWRQHGFGLLAVEERATGALVGRSGVAYHRAWPGDPEVGWGIDPDWWDRGLATEAGAACVRWAFEQLGLPRLVSITIEGNLASRRVMEKLGFRLHERVPFPELDLELWVHALDRPGAGDGPPAGRDPAHRLP